MPQEIRDSQIQHGEPQETLIEPGLHLVAFLPQLNDRFDEAQIKRSDFDNSWKLSKKKIPESTYTDNGVLSLETQKLPLWKAWDSWASWWIKVGTREWYKTWRRRFGLREVPRLLLLFKTMITVVEILLQKNNEARLFEKRINFSNRFLDLNPTYCQDPKSLNVITYSKKCLQNECKIHRTTGPTPPMGSFRWRNITLLKQSSPAWWQHWGIWMGFIACLLRSFFADG